MRFLGIDHGDRWFGLALSDPLGQIARPLEVVEGQEGTLARLKELISEEEVGEIVLGLPLNMDGSEGPKALQVREFRRLLEERFGLPVHEWDERLTSFEAERHLREAGLKGPEIKRRVDMVAAQIMLSAYLESRGDTEAAEGL